MEDLKYILIEENIIKDKYGNIVKVRLWQVDDNFTKDLGIDMTTYSIEVESEDLPFLHSYKSYSRLSKAVDQYVSKFQQLMCCLLKVVCQVGKDYEQKFFKSI